ncbi:hypothetical protein MLD38_012417 [Melastoma candidum]|uniref:Uncharacterized protein n=1 Tax=Melastoma candidum TaxID=119954 RepID=A0ACB9R6U5_9MYRT|nr:hypothetical protein MLD38_012417 [Melastoma candidum]
MAKTGLAADRVAELKRELDRAVRRIVEGSEEEEEELGVGVVIDHAKEILMGLRELMMAGRRKGGPDDEEEEDERLEGEEEDRRLSMEEEADRLDNRDERDLLRAQQRELHRDPPHDLLQRPNQAQGTKGGGIPIRNYLGSRPKWGILCKVESDWHAREAEPCR